MEDAAGLRCKPGDVLRVTVTSLRYCAPIYSKSSAGFHCNEEGEAASHMLVVVISPAVSFDGLSFVECFWVGGRGWLCLAHLRPFWTASMRKKT